MSRVDLIDEFFAAVERSDFEQVRKIYAPDAVIWHNDGQGEQTVDGNIAMVSALCGAVRSLRYDVACRTETDDGGVFAQHVLRVELPSGQEMAIDAAMYIRTDGVSISRIDEYIDTAVVQDLYAFVSQASGQGA